MYKPGIITRTTTSGHRDWREDVRRAIRDRRELLRSASVPDITPGPAAERAFPVRVPEAFAANIAPANSEDPLLRQVLPTAEEDEDAPGFVADAVGDRDAMPVPGVIHKYHGRVLLIATGACAIHCRYCFRRHFPYPEATAARHNWAPALQYIGSDPSIGEVILSGGDPLMVTTEKLAGFSRGLLSFPHVNRLRIHTRMPVVLPGRIDDELLRWLEEMPLQKVVVIHANHPNELDGAEDALRRLQSVGVTLLNQSVLLAGVNDDEHTLCDLSEALFALGVLPYYLHLLDPVAGAAHFQVDEEAAREIMDRVRVRLSGFLVPRLVREQSGAPYKLPVL